MAEYRSVQDLWGGLGPLSQIVFHLPTVDVFSLALVLLVLNERQVGVRVPRS
jgi:hypothetical protein